MFAKLKESKLFKSLSKTFCPTRNTPAKKDAATDSEETKTGSPKEPGKTSLPSAQ